MLLVSLLEMLFTFMLLFQYITFDVITTLTAGALVFNSECNLSVFIIYLVMLIYFRISLAFSNGIVSF